MYRCIYLYLTCMSCAAWSSPDNTWTASNYTKVQRVVDSVDECVDDIEHKPVTFHIIIKKNYQ